MALLKRPATLSDLERLPESVKGEIIDGVLYTSPRPRARHSDAIGHFVRGIGGPFHDGRGGPGGWWILPEPGITVPGSPEFSPDVAGWRRTRMAELPDGRIDLVPDWVCEILSPSNRHHDLRVKRPFYARIGVQFLWYVDLEGRAVTVSRLTDDKHWLELAVFGGDDKMRAEPFGEVEIALGEWWPPEPKSTP